MSSPGRWQRTLNNQEIREGKELALSEERPQRRYDCKGGARPCPWVGCKYNLVTDIKPSGVLMIYHSTMRGQAYEPDWDKIERENIPTCALDVIDEFPTGCTLDTCAKIQGRTRQAIEQQQLAYVAKAMRRAR